MQQIKKMWNSTHMRPVSYARFGIRPARDWKIVLIVTQCVVIILAGYAYYIYVQINSGTLFPVVENGAKKEITIDAVLLQKTVDAINTRAAASADLGQHAASSTDPLL